MSDAELILELHPTEQNDLAETLGSGQPIATQIEPLPRLSEKSSMRHWPTD
ncbi:hypothetical protein ACFO0A_12840 [Novosphingobium tardum]|uniref:Uncharacterized protein n=1 Tax=Novosphingobium tardum TaxID=1538021 RepID=A0ABV8RRM8_9SPHN